LRRLAEEKPEIIERLDRIEGYAQTIGEIPAQAMLPFHDQPEVVDLNDMLRKQIPIWCAPQYGVNLDIEGVSRNVKALVRANPKRLEVVLEILTTNAVQVMGGVSEKRLRVSSAIRSCRVEVEMTNTGKEIPSQVREQLFKGPIPKSQRTGGSGMGLLIARVTLRRYDGDIQLVRSGPEGTTFSFWLPLYRAAEELKL
jgi:signal transduction histidine kinase